MASLRDDKSGISAKKHKADNSSPTTPTKQKPSKETPSLELLLAEIRSVKDTTETTERKIDSFQQELKQVKYDLTNLSIRTTTIESKMDSATAQLKTINPLVAKIPQLVTSLEDLENRNRRGNLRVFGVGEGEESSYPSCEAFLEDFLPKLLNIKFAGTFEIDRGHRVPSRPKPNATTPRQFVLKVLRYQQLVQIRQHLRTCGVLRWKGKEIRIAQDFARATVVRRKQFLDMRPLLRERNIKYGLFDPCIFKITIDGHTKSFSDPDELTKFLQGAPQEPMELPT